jgi:Holliday junction resolvase RusA-like endonuclease
MSEAALLPASAAWRISDFGAEFTVYGTPASGGSKRAFKAKHSDRILVVDDNPKAKPWKQQVSDVAIALFAGRAPFAGPLGLELCFYVPRPKSHYGARGLLPSAPKRPIVKPDVTKLTRPLEDALTGIAWRSTTESRRALRCASRPSRRVL